MAACVSISARKATFAYSIRCRSTRLRQPPIWRLAKRHIEIYLSHLIHRTSLKVLFERPWKLNSSRKDQHAILATPLDGIRMAPRCADKRKFYDTAASHEGTNEPIDLSNFLPPKELVMKFGFCVQ
jgi:hypothetical protein